MDNKTLTLIGISYSSLLKIELPRFALRVLGIVENHNPEELQIKEIYDLLVAQKPNIAKLKDNDRKHPLTQDLSELRSMRSSLIGEIRYHLKVVIKKDKNGVDNNVRRVRDALNLFFNNLELSKNEEMFNQKVVQFYEAIDSSEELEDALTALDFQKDIDELRSVHANILELREERFINISQRSKDKTTDLIDSVLSTLMIMFKDLEVAPWRFPEIAYEPLFNELNDRLIYYRDLIN